MKYMKVPADVKLTNWYGEEIKDQKGEPVAPITFYDFIIGRLTDPKFSKDMATILRAFEIKTRAKKMGAYLALEDVDYTALLDVVTEPSPQAPYNSMISHCLVPFFKAVTEATSKEPEPVMPELVEPSVANIY
jgi:hypothetical protein